MRDMGFPIIRYDADKEPRDWGEIHGEEYREGIGELAHIRRELLVAKNPGIERDIRSLSLEQHRISLSYDGPLSEELEGLARGACVSLEDVIILNNYTDFRDIDASEEGCSSVYIKRGERSLAGQTWDMHASAKNFVCLIDVPGGGIFFSLVGCLGLMGFNPAGCFLGVNNLATVKARAGVLWPMVVRKALREETVAAMKGVLLHAPVTSGHNYLVASRIEGAHLEVTPTLKEEVSSLKTEGEIFHTNHCLGEETKKLEAALAVNSTSYDRYRLLERKVLTVRQRKDLVALLRDHENFPRSICSHTGQKRQDISATCGGGVVDFTQGDALCWRGCPEYDTHFKEYAFRFKDGLVRWG